MLANRGQRIKDFYKMVAFRRTNMDALYDNNYLYYFDVMGNNDTF